MLRFSSHNRKGRPFVRRLATLGVLCIAYLVSGPGTVRATSALQTGTTFTVNATDDADDGTCNTTHCSLREAINAANASAGTDTIAFDISGTGPHTIQPASPLPTIADPVIIDGTTEPDYAGIPVIELDGSAASGNGLYITAGSSTVRGLAIYGFGSDGIVIVGNGSNIIEGNYVGMDAAGTYGLGNGDEGISVINSDDNVIGGLADGSGNVISGNSVVAIYVGSTSAGNLIQGNLVGVDPNGTSPVRNGRAGIQIDGPDNIVGGTSAEARNILSGNGGYAIHVVGNSATGNLIQGNFIGTDITGTSAIPNEDGGVISYDTAGNVVGGADPGAGNLIAGNAGPGIYFSSAGNMIQGNLIGTDITGTAPLGNMGYGVEVTGPDGSVSIGGLATGEANTIAFNSRGGVAINSTSAQVPILSNSIFANGGLGIDLSKDGVTLNDPGDTDTGANGLQNFPVLTSVWGDGNNIYIQGTLDSAAAGTYKVELFANDYCDESNHGEGQTLLSTEDVSADSGGVVGFEFTLAGALPPDTLITARATDPDNNTSEFSECSLYLTEPPGAATLTSPNGQILLTRRPTCGTLSMAPPTTTCRWMDCQGTFSPTNTRPAKFVTIPPVR